LSVKNTYLYLHWNQYYYLPGKHMTPCDRREPASAGPEIILWDEDQTRRVRRRIEDRLKRNPCLVEKVARFLKIELHK